MKWPLRIRSALAAIGIALVSTCTTFAGGTGFLDLDQRLAPAPTNRVQLVLVGDIMLDRAPGAAIAQGLDPFSEFASILDHADLAVGNLECVVSDIGERVPKRFNFRAHPRVVPLLARYFDGLSLANNHTGDFGNPAFLDQLRRLDQAQIGHFGGGTNRMQAHAPLILERKHVRVALLGYDEIDPRAFEASEASAGVAWSLGQETRVVADIKAARATHKADVVIPFMHWGWEDETEPNERQQRMARVMIDAGADAVVGAHPHIVQGAEYYKGKLIVYSLGNFVFDGYEDRSGWVLRLTLNKQGVVEWETVVARTDARGIPHRVAEVLSPRGRAGSEAIGMGRTD
jgi:poly-gamma-glutamate synthesis protein (capsule biosynthesis protein)